ncbi:MAG: copper transport protein [Alyxoria varia]|nr:MAG: copper transport protein [Alyxoria varia]
MSLPLKDLSASAMRPMVVKAHLVHLRLLMISWTTHFRSVGYMKDSTMEMMDREIAQKTLELSATNYKISVRLPLTVFREAIGLNPSVWKDTVDVFRIAVQSLEQRSYGPLPPVSPMYDGPSSNTIVTNSQSLLKDLQRLDLLLQVCRNAVTAGEKAQNLAAQLGFDREVCGLINLCIKITARGYDGDGPRADEQKWQGVINGFKKLLITSLQFLSNLTTKNEPLKLMLWTELFESSAENAESDSPSPSNGSQEALQAQQSSSIKDGKKPMPLEQLDRHLDSYMENKWSDIEPSSILTKTMQQAPENNEQVKDTGAGVSSANDARATVIDKWDQLSEQEKAVSRDTFPSYKEHLRRLDFSDYYSRKVWREVYEQSKSHSRSDTGGWIAAAQRKASQASDSNGADQSNRNPDAGQKPASSAAEASKAEEYYDPLTKIIIMESAPAGLRKLQEGKTQLLRRLRNAPSEADHSMMVSANSSVLSPQSPPSPPPPPEEEEGEEEEEDSADMESSEEEDFALPGEDGRGLLTDVPLILGPNEIEVLPMVIMNGLVVEENVPKLKPSDQGPPVNLYTIRAHLLLAQENGRNLLRELLIFVAAWDLREEELYFKFMVKIVEAILKHGLMPFAYSAFKESKDIVSPAQAVLMKLLTKIFHSRGGFVKPPKFDGQFADLRPPTKGGDPSTPPVRPDVQVVQHLFAEFRSHIIPQICALIFLQGQIRQGNAHLEDFPLNLWDMERMYEGVYQYLEFFAILTDHAFWKDKFAEWEVVSELVTLLRELEIAIPKRKTPHETQTRQRHNHATDAATTPGQQQQLPQDWIASSSDQTQTNTPAQPPKAVSVERPYDTNDAGGDDTAASPAQQVDPANSTNPTHDLMHDEPADFEWRNLKKLCVLVLSSLVWKNKRLQDQVRKYGGVLVVLSCCAHDEHNPYIREHAIMCLRFLLEGNKENAEEVQSLSEGVAGHTVQWAAAITAASGGDQGDRENLESTRLGPVKVPVEVLDQHGYESFIDAKGQVGLRKKEVPAPPSPDELEDQQHQFAADIGNVNLSKERQAEEDQDAASKGTAGSGGHASAGPVKGEGASNSKPISSKLKESQSKPAPAEQTKPQQTGGGKKKRKGKK